MGIRTHDLLLSLEPGEVLYLPVDAVDPTSMACRIDPKGLPSTLTLWVLYELPMFEGDPQYVGVYDWTQLPQLVDEAENLT